MAVASGRACLTSEENDKARDLGGLLSLIFKAVKTACHWLLSMSFATSDLVVRVRPLQTCD